MYTMDQNRKKQYLPYFLCALLLIVVIYLKDVLHLLDIGWSLIFPFILGGCIAFVLSVPMNFIEKFVQRIPKLKKKGARGISLLITLLFIIAIILLVMFIVIPELADTFVSIGKQVPKAYKEATNFVNSLSSDYPEIKKTISKWDWDSTVQKVITFAQESASGLFSSSVSLISGVFNGVMVFFIGFIFSIYVLLQKETLSRQFKKLLFATAKKERAKRILTIGKLTHKTFSSFLSGQCLEACILGSLFFITMTILRFPYAMLIGILIAFTALIPMIGAFIGCAVGALLIVIVNPMQALWFIIMFLIIQQLEGNLIYPHVVGGSIGLPSIWVLAAVFIGGNLMGVAGMLIFIPLCSVLYSLLREWTNKRLLSRNISADSYDQSNQENPVDSKEEITTK